MSAAPPDALETVLSRITSPPAAVDGPPLGGRTDVTGELARLLSWWQRVSAGGPPRVAHVAPERHEADCASALVDGLAAADRAIDSGATLLVPAVRRPDGLGARTIVALLARVEASSVTFQRPAMSDREWMAECAQVRDRLLDVAGMRTEPWALLESLGATDIAFACGVLLGSAARRTASIVEGTEVAAAAVMADRLSFRARDWWRAGSTSPDPARASAARLLDLSPGLPLELWDADGLGAQATVALLDLLTRRA